MHRCSSGFLLTLSIACAAALTGCLGKNSPNPGNGGVSSVLLSPANTFSMDVGTTQVFSASGKNSSGGNVLGVEIQYVVSVPAGTTYSAPISIAANGNACAGTWDSTASICSPGTPGIAQVNAFINGVQSATTTVYVHQHVDSIQIVQAATQPPIYPCFSQGQVWPFEAIAYSNNVNVTNTVGPLVWSSSNTGVVTATPVVLGEPPNQQFNQAQITAEAPGITELTASVSGTNSSPYPYTTCLVQAIYLQIGAQSSLGNSIIVNSGASVPVTATAVDTLYPFTGKPIPNPPLTWSTSNPEVALFGTTTNNTGANSANARNNPGGASLTASCTPPTCNIGLPGMTPPTSTTPSQFVASLPIYATDGQLPNKTQGYAAISVDVTLSPTGKEPVYAAWAATTGCQNQSGCASSLFSLAPTTGAGANPIGTILSLPRTPNSLIFNHQAQPRLYIGSNEGLMYVDVAGTNTGVASVSSTPIPCNVSLCGKLLTVSNDGKLAVISDTVSTPNQVHIYNGSAASTGPIDLIIPGETATAAAFSPDQLKLFILTDAGNMYVYSTVDELTQISTSATTTDAKFSTNGSFGYIAGTPSVTSISGFANCDTPATDVLSSPITIPYATVLQTALYPLPARQLDLLGNWTDVVLALDPPDVDIFGVSVTPGAPLSDSEFVCNPPSVALDTNFFPAPALPVKSYNLGQGSFTPIYAQLVANGNELIFVAQNNPTVYIFNVNNGTTSSVQLINSMVPLAASASTDGTQVYVAACDQYPNNDTSLPCTLGRVHIISTIGQGGDIQQVPYINISDQNNNNMCNGLGTNAPLCIPDLIAIRPQ